MPGNDDFLKGFNSMLQLMGVKQAFENAKELSEYRKNMAETQRIQAETQVKQLEQAIQQNQFENAIAGQKAMDEHAKLVQAEAQRRTAQMAIGLRAEAGWTPQQIAQDPNFLVHMPDVKSMVEGLKGKEYAPQSAKTYIDPKTGKTAHIFPGQLVPPNMVPYSASGMKITMGPNGQLEVQTGLGPGLGTKVKGEIESKAFNLIEQQARIGGLLEGFKPEFLEIPTRAKASWSELKEKLAVGQLSEIDRQSLSELRDWQSGALRNINLYIKEITGAQMSEKEADRLRQGMPDPGEGIFGGDSPTVFVSKMKGMVKELERAAIRYQVMLKGGISEDRIKEMAAQDALPTWTEIKGMIDAMGATIEARIKLRNPRASKQSIQSQVLSELKEVYGFGNVQ